ncbi:MAG: fluoride efflux transporter CrcB [Epsilonproteobacteria bacterium]|nr:fluoride efflux transporter CrcB [Campylobacterota bacterium]NPA56099.1 fluoride efflux transporter CrcB [Campylobacterota bacterium]
MHLSTLFAVGMGGFLGALGRFLLATSVQKVTGSLFPWGTLTVNVVGSFAIGVLFVYFEQTVQPHLKGFLVTGFLGALTTFSTFSLETVLMVGEGAYLRALLNVLLNLFFSLGATIGGIIVAHRLWGV